MKKKKEVEDDITKRLQNMVKKKNTPTIVIKAGSVKQNYRSSDGTSTSDYYPSADN